MPDDKKKKWTVMVFMGAATIDGEEDLLDAAEDDLIEMASVGSGPVKNTNAEDAGAELNIFVQVYAREGSGEDCKTSARYGKIKNITPETVKALENRPVGDVFKAFGTKLDGPGKEAPIGPEAVEEFVKQALTAAEHDLKNPNHHSMLVFWGHAYDFAMNRTSKTDGTIDALDFAELTTVLKKLQEKYPGVKLDILGFDACCLATVEMTCQFEPFAKYMLASQIGIPIPGWPYDRILDRLRNPYGRLMNPLEFGSYAVRRYCEAYTPESLTVSLTLLNLKRVNDLEAHTECLASTLSSVMGNPGARDWLAYLIAQSQTDVGQPFVDLGDLCFNLVRNGGDAYVIESARALGDLLISPPRQVIGKRSGNPEDSEELPFVIEHGRNSGQTARLNGINVYAPHVAPRRDFNKLQHQYLNFEFAKTQWSALMHSLARLG